MYVYVTEIEGLQKSYGTRNNSFSFWVYWLIPSIVLDLSDIPIAISPPSALANATIGMANALGGYFSALTVKRLILFSILYFLYGHIHIVCITVPNERKSSDLFLLFV